MIYSEKPARLRIVTRLFAALLCLASACNLFPTSNDDENNGAAQVCPTWPQPQDDAVNPGYEVLAPNGGETVQIGDTLRIKITSQEPGNADVKLGFGDGLVTVQVLNYALGLGSPLAVDPQEDSVLCFVIPDSIDISGIRYSMVSEYCYIHILDYSKGSKYFDFSDCYFSIH